MSQRLDFIATARKEIGTKEQPVNSNKVKYNDNKSQPWCGYFVMWCAKQVKLNLPNCVYTLAGAAGFQGKGLWSNAATTKPLKGGEIAFFNFPGGESVDHVGIVIKDNGDGTVTTVEGNTSVSGSQSNGGEVCEKIRAYKKDNKKKLPVFIAGFGHPKFIN